MITKFRNFGSNGTTAQSDGDYPYVRTGVCGESKNFLWTLSWLNWERTTPSRKLEDEKHFMEEYRQHRYLPLAVHPQVVLLTRCVGPYREEHHQSRIIEEKVRLVVNWTADTITDWVLLICIICLATSGIRSLCGPFASVFYRCGCDGAAIGDYLLILDFKVNRQPLYRNATSFNFHGIRIRFPVGWGSLQSGTSG